MEKHVEKLQRALGFAIRQQRQTLGYSQESFADKVGIHRTYFSAIERGERNPSLRNLVRIAAGLSLPLSKLFEDAEKYFKSAARTKT